MKAIMLFEQKGSGLLQNGRVLTAIMDCYQIRSGTDNFADAFRFSWIVYDPDNTADRVLMDQHGGKPAHLHIGNKEVLIKETFVTVDAAVEFFFVVVEKHFGPLEWEFES